VCPGAAVRVAGPDAGSGVINDADLGVHVDGHTGWALDPIHREPIAARGAQDPQRFRSPQQVLVAKRIGRLIRGGRGTRRSRVGRCVELHCQLDAVPWWPRALDASTLLLLRIPAWLESSCRQCEPVRVRSPTGCTGCRSRLTIKTTRRLPSPGPTPDKRSFTQRPTASARVPRRSVSSWSNGLGCPFTLPGARSRAN
jgi:hypothetical protein